jgi:hypothetical protein
MKHIAYLFLALLIVCLTGCGRKTRTASFSDPQLIPISDPQLAPLIQAIHASDRASLGFSSIPADAAVYLHSDSNARRDVEIMVFNSPAQYNDIYRDIEFRKTETGYKWIREIENHPGPKTFNESGHTKHEEIWIAYDTTDVYGITPNKLLINYEGRDSPFTRGKDVTLDEARQVLAKWSQRH